MLFVLSKSWCLTKQHRVWNERQRPSTGPNSPLCDVVLVLMLAGVGYKQPYDNFGDGDDDDLALPQGSLSWRAEVVEVTALNERDHENAATAAANARKSSSDG